jgi:type II secretory pathway pseudopilin PulG
MVMVCLAVALAAVLGMLRSAIVEQQQLRTQRQNLQVVRLAEAGVDRAHAQLSRAADYQGETWDVPANELSSIDAAAVTITVKPVADHPDQRSIHVQADYPNDPVRRIRKTLETTLVLDQKEEQR